MFHNFQNPLKKATDRLSEPPAPIPLAKALGLALAAASLDSQIYIA